MNKLYLHKISAILLAGLLVLTFSCDKHGSSLFDPNYESSRPTPVISEILPVGGYLAGVDSIIIKGENFAIGLDSMTINFSGVPGTIKSSTPTQMVVRPGQIVGDSIKVLLSVRGSEFFSNDYYYSLKEAIFAIPGYDEHHNSTGLTVNAAGDVIFSLQNENGANQGIKVWRSNDDLVEDYLPSKVNWRAMKVGPDGLLYAVQGNFAVYREDAGVIDIKPYAIGVPSEAYRNLDFGTDNYLWVVGKNDNILRVNISNGSITRFPFSAELRAVRYYDGILYVGGNVGGSEQIWKFDVVNNQLQNEVLLLNIDKAEYPDLQILEITLDVEGTLYIGANTGSGIYTWSNTNGLKELYAGLIKPTAFSFAWIDSYLVASVTNQNGSTRHPLKINVLKQGAPYLGIE
ncbi:MAG: IPT/TIG domain-containing protein [Balneolaceae bacterium]